MSNKDKIIKEIEKSGYSPKTSLENIADNVLCSFNPSEENGEFGDEFTVEGCLKYVDASGEWTEFDSKF